MVELKVTSLCSLQARKMQSDLTDCIRSVGAAVALRRAMDHKQGRPPSRLHTSLVKLSSTRASIPRGVPCCCGWTCTAGCRAKPDLLDMTK